MATFNRHADKPGAFARTQFSPLISPPKSPPKSGLKSGLKSPPKSGLKSAPRSPPEIGPVFRVFARFRAFLISADQPEQNVGYSGHFPYKDNNYKESVRNNPLCHALISVFTLFPLKSKTYGPFLDKIHVFSTFRLYQRMQRTTLACVLHSTAPSASAPEIGLFYPQISARIYPQISAQIHPQIRA
ncbi:hypothetical protein SuNHUV7_30950 (plasmid) [Pseudoseohaeicola sp. NH-UV-7]